MLVLLVELGSTSGGHFAGIVYGLYLTLSSWVLFHVATGMTFFADKCHLADLNTTPQVLMSYCQSVRRPSAAPFRSTLHLELLRCCSARKKCCDGDILAKMFHRQASGTMYFLRCCDVLAGLSALCSARKHAAVCPSTCNCARDRPGYTSQK